MLSVTRAFVRRFFGLPESSPSQGARLARSEREPRNSRSLRGGLLSSRLGGGKGGPPLRNLLGWLRLGWLKQIIRLPYYLKVVPHRDLFRSMLSDDARPAGKAGTPDGGSPEEPRSLSARALAQRRSADFPLRRRGKGVRGRSRRLSPVPQR